MRNDFIKQLSQSDNIHIPLPIDENECAETRLAKKTVLKSRLIDNMENLDYIDAITENIKLEITSERFVSGGCCLKMSCPTNLDGWDTERGHGVGRIYDIPSAYRRIDNEDWTEFNRISFWIYPECKGIKSPSFRVQIHNDGEHKVPDVHMREGGHNMNLKHDCWNFIVLEIPYLARDKVIGVSFDYDMVGHEPDAVNHCSWYIDKLMLEQVECDVYEGWVPANDRIVYSHSGYQTGAMKTAIAADINADSFKVIETKTGKVVLEKPIVTVSGMVGCFKLMDFSEIMDEGDYIIVAGGLSTRAFAIGTDVWETSIWKMLNFFLVLRCGYEVTGKHLACHSDMLLKHGDKSIVANGGWHDAGDLAQGMTNTCEATAALFTLARSLKGKNDQLYKRVLEEAKWGLDFVMKTRFGDGFRLSYSSCSIWTDGVIGTNDDVHSEAINSAYTNFDAAYAMLLGAEALSGSFSAYALKLAKEDYRLAKKRHDSLSSADITSSPDFVASRGDFVEIQVCSMAALAAVMLYRLTGEENYKLDALAYSKCVLACQQQSYTDWDVAMIGFYYESSDQKLIWHHNHMSYSYLPNLVFETLCETFSDDSMYMQWYNALVLNGKFYKDTVKYTSPYGVIPSGVYHEDEGTELLDRVISNHPILAGDAEKDIPAGYANLVRKGFPLGGGYYLRVYPVWFSFRGNYNVILSDGKAAGSACNIINDVELYNISQRQFAWIVGNNPMAQSTMYGEGYDYVQLYAVQPGQTVGAISVGMQSNGDNDEPFWPQVNNATYKEVWVASANKWMWCMADSFSPTCVCGCLKYLNENITFTHQSSNKQFVAEINPRTGWFEILLPAGEYKAYYSGISKDIKVTAGKTLNLDGELYNLSADYKTNGDAVTVTLKFEGHYPISLSYKGYNLEFSELPTIIGDDSSCISFDVNIKQKDRPFILSIIPNGNYQDRTEIIA